MPFNTFSSIFSQVLESTQIFSPSLDKVNLIITVTSGSWVSPVECLDGNPINNATSFIRAYAKRDEKIAQTVDLEITSPEFYGLKGRCIEPITLPTNFRPNNIYRATFEGVEGYFYSLRTPHNPFGVQNEVGSRINGLWSSQKFN
jgi:hypothetical protein